MKSYHSDSQDNTNPALQCRQQVSEVLKDDEAEADKTIENVYPPYYVKYDIPGIARTLGYSLEYASTINICQSSIAAC